MDWGTDDDDKGKEKGDGVDEVDAVSSGPGGMEIDPDLEMDMAVMQGCMLSIRAFPSFFRPF